MYVLGLPACLRAALSISVVGSHVGHARAARGGAFGVERPETPFQTIIGTRNRDRNMVAQRFLERVQTGPTIDELRELDWRMSPPRLSLSTVSSSNRSADQV